MGAGDVVPLYIAVDLAPLEGLVVAWSALARCGRRRRCSIVNRSRSGSVRGSGGCLVGSGRVWAPATLFHCKSQYIDLAPLEGLVVAWSALVGCGRRRLCSTTLVRGVAVELEAENWRVSSTTLVRGAICGAGS